MQRACDLRLQLLVNGWRAYLSIGTNEPPRNAQNLFRAATWKKLLNSAQKSQAKPYQTTTQLTRIPSTAVAKEVTPPYPAYAGNLPNNKKVQSDLFSHVRALYLDSNLTSKKEQHNPAHVEQHVQCTIQSANIFYIYKYIWYNKIYIYIYIYILPSPCLA